MARKYKYILPEEGVTYDFYIARKNGESKFESFKYIEKDGKYFVFLWEETSLVKLTQSRFSYLYTKCSRQRETVDKAIVSLERDKEQDERRKIYNQALKIKDLSAEMQQDIKETLELHPLKLFNDIYQMLKDEKEFNVINKFKREDLLTKLYKVNSYLSYREANA